MSIRILHLISSRGFFGAEKVVIELAKELCSLSNYQVFIGVFKDLREEHLEIAEKAKESNSKVEIFPCRGRFDLETVSSIRTFIKYSNIDILHSHGYKSNFYAILATLFMNTQKVTTCHNWIGTGYKMKFYEKLDKFLLNRFDKVISVSSLIEKEILDNGISKSKVVIIDNGIDIDKFTDVKNIDYLRKEFNLNSDSKIIGTIGRLSAEKGLLYFLEASKRVLGKFPHTKFLIVGDGPLRQELQKESVKLGIEKDVIFTGIRNDIPEVLSLMDIFVLPSLKEGLPISLLEAMAAKKSIIATNVGGVPGVIKNGDSGILIEPKDVQGLVDNIIELIKNRKKAIFLAQNAYEKVKKEFSSKKMAEKYIWVYNLIFDT